MIEFEQRHIVGGIGGIDNIHAPVVEDEPMLLLAYGKHSMEIQSSRLDPDHDQAAIIGGDANLAKRKSFKWAKTDP